jgi:Mn-dependent DtxR family transcriptional regulator
MPTPAVQDYLKAIYKLSRGGSPATTSAIADRLGIAAASVTGMLKRLAEQGMVEHVPYAGARLTPLGEEEAVRMIRRHRIIELFLVEVLGYTWDRVHEEAERLEGLQAQEAGQEEEGSGVSETPTFEDVIHALRVRLAGSPQLRDQPAEDIGHDLMTNGYLPTQPDSTLVRRALAEIGDDDDGGAA